MLLLNLVVVVEATVETEVGDQEPVHLLLHVTARRFVVEDLFVVLFLHFGETFKVALQVLNNRALVRYILQDSSLELVT